MQNDLTVVIPYYNGQSTIHALLDSLLRFAPDVPIIVVDDLSDKAFTTAPYKNNNIAAIRLDTKGYFSGAVNAGINACETDVLVLNQDIVFKDNTWINLINANREKYAMIGDGVLNHPAWPKGYVQGTFMFMRRDAILAVGLLNQADYPLWGATCEWQLRACRKGYLALPLKLTCFAHARLPTQRFGSAIDTVLKREPNKKELFVRTPPAISIVMPCYNVGRYLPDAIHSLIGGDTSLGTFASQTMQSFEVIIVDDGSTDNSVEIAKTLIDPAKGIRLIVRGKNGGTPAANNSGIRAAYGKYIAILDADDMMDEGRLRIMYDLAISNPHKVIYDDMQCFANGKKTDVLKMYDYDFDRLLEKNQMHAGILFPRTAFDDTGGYNEKMVYGREDWCFNVGLGIAGYCGVHIKKPMYLYRREKQNWSLKNRGAKWRDTFRQQIASIYPDIYKGARPNMCCGSGNKKVSNSGAKSAAVKNSPVVAGGTGMVLLEYIGNNWGSQSFYGPVTGSQYVVSKANPVVPVDLRDVEYNKKNRRGLLDQGIDGKKMFRRYAGGVRAQTNVAPAKILPDPVVTRQAQTAVTETEIVTTDDTVIATFALDIAKILSSNVLEIRAMDLSAYTQEQINDLILAETEGKNRKYVLAKLGTYLDN